MSTLFHPLRVKAIEPDTAEAVIVSFEVPADLQQVFGFTQGQYLTLRHEMERTQTGKARRVIDTRPR